MFGVRWILFTLLANLCICNGYKLLLVFPLASKSHNILGNSLAKHLLDAGHEVTYVTPYVKTEAHSKLKVIDVSEVMKFFTSEDALNVQLILDKKLNFRDQDILTNILMGVAINTLENNNIQKFIRDPTQKFDAVVCEWMFSDLYSVFGTLFDCPLIWLSTLDPHWIISDLIDGPLNPAYSGDYLHDHVPPFSFFERIEELWIRVDGLLRKNLVYYYKEEAVYQRVIVPILQEKGRLIPSYETVRRNASLVLGNSQVVIGDAVSLPQSYKHVGGYHIDDQVKPLPEDLKKLLDNSKHGIIYFSMGTNLKSKDLPTELKKNILKVFAGLKQTVIWKFEEVIPDAPKNVYMLQWAPQQSILAHPNTVLFITHGGLLSITETIHFGVPVITIPVFADQFINSVRAERRGFGKKLELSYTMDKDIKAALDEVLVNPKYSARVKEISVAYHDRPLKPKEELLHWISHVIRTRGAPHLRSPALNVYLYQRLYLDLIAIILFLIYIIISICKRISRAISKCNNKEKRL